MTLQAKVDIEYDGKRIKAGEAIPDWLPEDSVKELKANGAIASDRVHHKIKNSDRRQRLQKVDPDGDEGS